MIYFKLDFPGHSQLSQSLRCFSQFFQSFYVVIKHLLQEFSSSLFFQAGMEDAASLKCAN